MKLWRVLYLPLHLGDIWYADSRYAEAKTRRGALALARRWHPSSGVAVEYYGEAWE